MTSSVLILDALNVLVDTAQWLVLLRLVMALLVRNPANAVWRVLLLTTEPVFQVSRALTWGRVPERWMWLVSLLWLTAVRVAVRLLQRAHAG